LLFPDQEQREIVAISYRLYSDAQFRSEFWADPAGALVRAGHTADASTVDRLRRMDRDVVEKIARDWRDIATRSSALKQGAGIVDEPAVVVVEALAFAAAYAAATVGAHYLAHYLLSSEELESDI
jgi:hypothetical protein